MTGRRPLKQSRKPAPFFALLHPQSLSSVFHFFFKNMPNLTFLAKTDRFFGHDRRLPPFFIPCGRRGPRLVVSLCRRSHRRDRRWHGHPYPLSTDRQVGIRRIAPSTSETFSDQPCFAAAVPAATLPRAAPLSAASGTFTAHWRPASSSWPRRPSIWSDGTGICAIAAAAVGS